MGACSASVPKPSIDFHGGAAFIINRFKGSFASKIRSAIESQICSSSTISSINSELAKVINEIPSNIHFMNSFYLNVDLLQPPIINTSLETDLKGEVFWMDNHEECPLPVRPMEIIPPSVGASMIAAQISSYLFNSFAYVAHKNKIIRMTITSKNIPNKSILNTTCSNGMCIGHLIPAIGKLYPNQVLSVFVESFQMPDVFIKSGDMLLDVYLNVYLYLSTDSPNKPLLILPLTIHTEGKSDIAKQIIHFKLSALSVKLGVIRKGLPIKINEKQFQMTINLFVNMFVLPQLNKKGETGIPISTLIKTNKISNTKLHFGMNSALLMTDISMNFTEVDYDWPFGSLQLLQSTLVMPNYAMSISLFKALQTAFSDDPNRFYNQENIIDDISLDI
ncbi:uncharacterized protein LOC115216297 [Octopus sinensis]|uniref:Uncharacterized protein LOC115216297 n=1 Tax=Octopus sinensis TaxID=2607531 RepID=A0A6P7SSV7_9MOLL|nr:uncharacterized protein LOC115216297 [Octopus sinensis]